MSDLKPCPFCGLSKTRGKQQHISFAHSEDMDWSRWCQRCGCCGPAGASKPEATKAWNERSAIRAHEDK